MKSEQPLLDLRKLPASKVLTLYVGVLDELRRRKLVRSTNNPVADIAELLVVQALDLALTSKSNRGYDATDLQGNRYEIKARRITAHNKSRQLSFIRGLNEPERPFDYLAGVLFDEGFSLSRACLIPVDVIPKVAQHRERENAWRLQLHDKLWELDGVQDLTAKLKAVESRLLGRS